jgi:hypothetical protein
MIDFIIKLEDMPILKICPTIRCSSDGSRRLCPVTSGFDPYRE